MERDLKRQIHVGIKARSHQNARNARYSSGMARQSRRVFRRISFLPSSALPRRLAKKLLSQFSTLLVSCYPPSSLIQQPPSLKQVLVLMNSVRSKPELLNPIHWIHWTHCLEMIRQELICMPSMHLSRMVWQQAHREPTPEFRTHRMCMRWEDYHSMAKEREMPKAVSFTLPPLLCVYVYVWNCCDVLGWGCYYTEEEEEEEHSADSLFYSTESAY